MFLFRIFQSFLPLHNPIGFGAADFIEFCLAALLVLLLLFRNRAEVYARRLAVRTGWCMLLLALLPVVLRLALLPHHAIPSPRVCDEFSYLLLADTLRHFRLANPAHPMHRFFESLFVQQEPTYSSIYPLGQGLVLAAGRILGHPWVGVAISVGSFCALCYWMLRGWTTPLWSLLGGLLAAIEFGPLNLWMNCYWGGAASASAGCLVFGAIPRLRRTWRTRDAVLLGAGLAIQLLTRPFEFILLSLAALLFLPLNRPDWEKLARIAPAVALSILPAGLLTLAHNKAVTGSWTTLPYVLSRYQYGIPTTFTFQPNPVPHLPLNQEQQIDYEVQSEIHGKQPETPARYAVRMAERVRFYRFFFLAPLYLALPFFLIRLRDPDLFRVFLAVAIFSLGTNFYPYFYPHYIAAIACLLILAAVTGLARMSQWQICSQPAGRQLACALLALCATHFLFWYGLHLVADERLAAAMWPYESWDNIVHGDPEGRDGVAARLAESPGRHLVFVRYGSKHLLEEWIQNAADIDNSRIIWANDLGADEDEKLIQYYPGRQVWLLEPDKKPPRLVNLPANR
jgi:hypothetical protein